MRETKFTVYVSRELFENAKEYAIRNNTTLNSLIEVYLRSLRPNLPWRMLPLSAG